MSKIDVTDHFKMKLSEGSQTVNPGEDAFYHHLTLDFGNQNALLELTATRKTDTRQSGDSRKIVINSDRTEIGVDKPTTFRISGSQMHISIFGEVWEMEWKLFVDEPLVVFT